jgi:hypothetical protein
MSSRSRARIHVGLAVVFLSFLTSGNVSASEIFWTNWVGTDTDPGTGFRGQGTITTPTATVNVTYANPAGIGFYQTGAAGETDYWTPRNNATSPYTSAAVDNVPTGTDIIALQFIGLQTLTFSEAIANPVFSYVSLNGNGYAFLNQDFNLLSFGDGSPGNACGFWGCGTSTKNIVNLPNGDIEYQLLGTGEPHGTIQFTGAFDTLTWRSLNNEFWNGFTVGVQGTADEVFPPGPSVPEPSSLVLLGTGLMGLILHRRRRGK